MARQSSSNLDGNLGSVGRAMQDEQAAGWRAKGWEDVRIIGSGRTCALRFARLMGFRPQDVLSVRSLTSPAPEMPKMPAYRAFGCLVANVA